MSGNLITKFSQDVMEFGNISTDDLTHLIPIIVELNQ